jgi:outer membrane protein
LNAEQQLYTAQRDLLKARYDTLFQGFKLKAAAGVLAESDVVEVNSLLAHGTEVGQNIGVEQHPR